MTGQPSNKRAGELRTLLSSAAGGRSDILSSVVGGMRGALMTVGLFSFFVNLLMLAGPLYMLQVYDRVLSSGSADTLLVLTLMLAVAILTMAVLETARTMLTVRLGSWFTKTLGPKFLQSGIRAGISGDTSGGQAIRDLSQVQSFVATQGMTAFFDLPWVPLFIGAIWLLHPWLGQLALATALILLLLSVLNELLTRRLMQEVNARQIAAQRICEAAIENAESVHTMAMGRSLEARWASENAVVQSALLRASERGSLAMGCAKFARFFAQSAILGLAAYLVLGGEATPGVMVAASIMLGRALAPLDMAMTAWKNFSSTRLAYGRLKASAKAYPEPRARMSLPRPDGRLSVKNLTASGPGGGALRRVSFEADPGTAIAVVGPSGAGKTSLCRYLVGLALPSAGSVRLGGSEIGHFRPDELGRHIGFLSQSVGLFAGTIRENIARMGESADESVLEAAELAQAHEMICALPDGYETRIGPRGAGLSAGQRQRIGLARALFGTPSLIVLDEPNANLDEAGEAALSAAVLKLKSRGSTLIIVGHRPSTLNQSDKILLLREGAVKAFGPRNEVLDLMREARAARTIVKEEAALANQ